MEARENKAAVFMKKGSKIAPSESLLKEVMKNAKSKKESKQNKAKGAVTKR